MTTEEILSKPDLIPRADEQLTGIQAEIALAGLSAAQADPLPATGRGDEKASAELGFSELVTVVRQQLFISQEKLARQLGVSFATVNRWENGRHKPSRLAQTQMHTFCNKMIASGKLVFQKGQRPRDKSKANRADAPSGSSPLTHSN